MYKLEGCLDRDEEDYLKKAHELAKGMKGEMRKADWDLGIGLASLASLATELSISILMGSAREFIEQQEIVFGHLAIYALARTIGPCRIPKASQLYVQTLVALAHLRDSTLTRVKPDFRVSHPTLGAYLKVYGPRILTEDN